MLSSSRGLPEGACYFTAQALLSKRDLYKGNPSGQLDAATVSALARLCKMENLSRECGKGLRSAGGHQRDIKGSLKLRHGQNARASHLCLSWRLTSRVEPEHPRKSGEPALGLKTKSPGPGRPS
jgi:hypothetical protein